MNLTTLAVPFFATLGLITIAGANPVLTPIPALASAARQGPGGHHGYGLQSLHGSHGFTYQGTSAVLGLIASSGRIDFDGSGNLSADYTTSVNGVAFTGQFIGTYTVNTDGTGSVTLNLPQMGMQAHGNFVLVDGGKESFFTSTDMGYSVVGRTRRM